MLRNIAFKHRVVGAIFIISLGIIVIPAILDKPAVDTLAVQSTLPAAPTHGDWQELTEIDYSFNELVGDLQVEEAAAPVVLATAPADELAPLTLVQEEAPALIEPVTAAAEPVVMAAAETVPEEPQVEAPAEVKVVQAAESLVANNVWAVQLGAFSKAENAQALLDRLEDKGYAAYVHEMADKHLTRVLVGVAPNQTEAAALLAELDSTMHLKGIIVKFDPEDGTT